MLFSRNYIQVDIYINHGNDSISHKRLATKPGISVLEALDQVASVEYTPDESATGHHGAMVTAIDGLRIDLYHFWIYYFFEKNKGGWTIPMCTPDSLKITEDTRIAWRYHTAISGKDMQTFGPQYTSMCISKIKRCNRQF